MEDYRQQQELEEERMKLNLAMLRAARKRALTDSELLSLASELGLWKEWRQDTRTRDGRSVS